MKYLIVTRAVTTQSRLPMTSYPNMTVEQAIDYEKNESPDTALDMIRWDDNVVQSVRVDIFDDGKVEK